MLTTVGCDCVVVTLWLHAPNTGTSSVLLPPMPQLIYSYTAEDVVEANTMVAPPLPPTGLASIPETIPESPIKEDAPPSASSRLG